MRKCILASALVVSFLFAPLFAALGQGKDTNLSDLEKSAKQFVEFLEKGEFDKATKDYDEAMQKALPADKLKETWKTVLGQVGAFKKQVSYRTQKIEKYDVVLVTCEFEKLSLDVRVVFNDKKQVSGLQFLPSKK